MASYGGYETVRELYRSGLASSFSARKAGETAERYTVKLYQPFMADAMEDRLQAEIVSMIQDAIQSACRSYAGPGAFSEAEEFPLAVYGREGEACRNCETKIRRIAQGGRSTYFCPKCQK